MTEIPAFIIKDNMREQFMEHLLQKYRELDFYGYTYMEYPEEWRLIDCFDIKKGLYLISNYGRVYSYATQGELSILPSNGYRQVALQRHDGTRKTYQIHRLVAYTFIPQTEEDIEMERTYINHMNLHRDCNFGWNLEYVTNQENIQHAIDNNAVGEDYSYEYSGLWGRGDLTYGENNGMSEWTEQQVHIICQNIQDGRTTKEALIAAGIPVDDNAIYNVSHIVQGKRWKHISSQYNIQQKWKITDKSAFVIPVCERLQMGMMPQQIIDDLPDLPGSITQKRAFIGGIKRRKYYTDISCNYNW